MFDEKISAYLRSAYFLLRQEWEERLRSSKSEDHPFAKYGTIQLPLASITQNMLHLNKTVALFVALRVDPDKSQT